MADTAADIVWAVAIDASAGLSALSQSLDAAVSQLETVDTRAKDAGNTVSNALTGRTLTIDSKSLESVGAALLTILDRLVAIQTNAATASQVASGTTPLPAPATAATPSAPAPTSPAGPQAKPPAPQVNVSPAVERTRVELLSMQRTAEGVGAAFSLAFDQAEKATQQAQAAGNLAAAAMAKDWQRSLLAIVHDFDAGTADASEALRAIGTTAKEQATAIHAAMADAANMPAPRPVTVQSGLASGPIRQAREELLATQRTADGVGAALRLAASSLVEIKAPEEFLQSIRSIQKDFLAGRATADESLRAIVSAQRAASAEVMSAKQQEAQSFKDAEKAKEEAARATLKAQQEQAAATARNGQVFSTLTATAGSAAAMMLSLEERTRAAHGETSLQLFGLHQLQEGIPHVTSLLVGLAAAGTGGPAGILAGIPAIITGITGIFAAINKPPPRPPSQRESLEDVFSRVQTGALRTDDAQATRERMARSLEIIERHTAHRESRPPVVGT